MSPPRRERLSQAGRKVKAVPRPNLIERRMSKVLREPPSVRLAASVIVTATVMIVVGGGILIRVVDHHEYPSIWVGMWFALQTVTTVGYGDVTPKDPAGRVIAALVMIEGIAFLTIVTAAITSTFVARGNRERFTAAGDADETGPTPTASSLYELAQRLDRLESMLGVLIERTGSGTKEETESGTVAER